MFSKGTKEGNGVSSVSSKEVCIIATGTTVTGNINVAGNMRLDGTIKGDVTSGGGIVMSVGAVIIGNINCQYIVTEGKVDGNITAKAKVHLMSTAKIKGNVHYKALQTEEGAIINGQVTSANARQNAPRKEE